MSQATALECTPATYARIFEGDPNGQLVLSDLCRKFYKNPYVKGGLEAERQTNYNAGQSSVVNHILKQIGRSAESDDAQE